MMLRSALRLINVAITTLLQKQQVKGWYVPLLITEHLSYSCNCLCEHQSFLQVWTWFNSAAVSQTRALWFFVVVFIYLYSCYYWTRRRLTKANGSSLLPDAAEQPVDHRCAGREGWACPLPNPRQAGFTHLLCLAHTSCRPPSRLSAGRVQDAIS